MKAIIKGNRLIIDTEILTGDEAPFSSTGKRKMALTTNGWTRIESDTGDTYYLSMNLIIKPQETD